MDQFEVLVAVERLFFAWEQISDKETLVERLEGRLADMNLSLSTSPHRSLFLPYLGTRKDHNVADPDTISSEYGLQLLVLENALAHNYSKAISLLESSTVGDVGYIEWCRCMMRLNILGKSYGNNSELDIGLRSYLRNGAQGSSLLLTDEVSDCRMLGFASLFLQEEYFIAVHHMVRSIHEHPSLVDYLLREEDGRDIFILKEEYKLMLTIAVLVAIPLENYQDFLLLEDLNPLLQGLPELHVCLNLLVSTSFGSFFARWLGPIQELANRSCFLAPVWHSVNSHMRSKILVFYIKISERVTVSYLARTLDIPYDTVMADVSSLIQKFDINIGIEGDLVYYKEDLPVGNLVSKVSQIQREIDSKLLVMKQKNDALRSFIENMLKEQSVEPLNRSQDMDAFELHEQSEDEEYEEEHLEEGENV
ncbi:ACL027Cp [Eremothecium gossypii ATCC 10895]|uniref:COP9 signalosome complex subunit 11 n=1 Tax=Eremothecium gossypii (strain ATCC 10895 / CBS 109.51 / FGSC 9923 / NRRL Y-1056) TaxID=284811 RepID=CSN11_EREGS|nr:ACL027Cp [Eremothecium gossypii ATCC 10895]Q75CD6.1 RecName: Full=COP9 signalosome complex subunit 11 [Eremothecium gossypii ATCC 10895]AAS51201.1 ACL027Cp [Eremothecium gossypii ATCC 10895]